MWGGGGGGGWGGGVVWGGVGVVGGGRGGGGGGRGVGGGGGGGVGGGGGAGGGWGGGGGGVGAGGGGGGGYGTEDKRPAAEQTLARLGLDWSQAAAIGDDWPDLPLLRRATLACAPPGAHAEARACAHHVTVARGGEGAAREFCDLLLVAVGHYRRLLDAQHRGGAT